MTLRRAIFTCGLSLWGLLALSGCHKAQDANAVLNRPVAIINDEAITLDAFQNAWQQFSVTWDRFVPPDDDKKLALRKILLDNLIDDHLMDQEARRRNIDVRDDVLRDRVHQQLQGANDTDMDVPVTERDASMNEWLRLFKKRLVMEKLVSNEVISKIHLSETEMRAYYNAHPEMFLSPEKVRVRHIAVADRATYDKVVKDLADNVDFITLVRQYSITPDRLNDGDLGLVERGELPPEMDQAIFKLRGVGQRNPLGRPVQTQIGYHIFVLIERSERHTQDFAEAMPLIRNHLVSEKMGEAYQTWLADLRRRASIHVNQELLSVPLE